MGEKKKALILSIMVLFFLVSFLFDSSVGASSAMWSQTYGYATSDEDGCSLVATSDGGYALLGYTGSMASEVFWLVKTDAYGYVEWNQTYGGNASLMIFLPPIERACSLVVTSDGGYAIAGYADSFGVEGADFWLIKTDILGNMEWNRTYGGAESDIAHSLVVTSDGGYAIAGATASFGAGNEDFWLVKTDELGNIEWNQTYGGAEGECAYSLVKTIDGGYVLAGYSWSISVNPDFWLVKTDEFGNMEWNQSYVQTEWDKAFSLVAASDGGYALAGYTRSFGAGNDDFWLVKTDEFGIMEWNQTYGGPGWEQAKSIVEVSDGGYAIAGRMFPFGAGSADFWLVKTDGLGNMEWNQTYGDSQQEESAESLIVTSDGGYALVGQRSGDCLLVKTDEMGYVPEYSSWLISTLLLATTVIILVYRIERISGCKQSQTVTHK